ncbi:hypothetical protein OS965_02675 [Streptomyces sp. H27-G5]|uniref:hypothetical protein n=1 Tax=Streptomyces sp. H27-G5 TaxID=2996698 RepID=UPI00226F62C9|nr:hypothetical protein [Streptomyces sp. H27-G5]MCY0917082.1 hypothetical protein [Streptomyces sp. H27-G5]
MIRSAEIVNAEIRELWADGSLPPEARDRYHRLVVEWAEAKRAESESAELAA